MTHTPIRRMAGAVLLGASLLATSVSAKDAGAGTAGSADAGAQRTTIVEAVPLTTAATTARIFRVSADRTPSGFPVPRYVSLKFGTVNARTGPSRDHSVAYQYQRRGLPLIVVAETEMWRKVRDIQGDEAWVRKPALSGERAAILLSETVLRNKPDPDARATARIERGTLVSLKACEGRYCRIETQNGLSGFTAQSTLWGAQDL